MKKETVRKGSLFFSLVVSISGNYFTVTFVMCGLTPSYQ